MMTSMYIACTALCALLRWVRTCLVQVTFIQRLKTGQEREGVCAGSKEKERVVEAVDRELDELKRRLLKLEGERADTEKAATERIHHLEDEVAAVKVELTALKREFSGVMRSSCKRGSGCHHVVGHLKSESRVSHFRAVCERGSAGPRYLECIRSRVVLSLSKRSSAGPRFLGRLKSKIRVVLPLMKWRSAGCRDSWHLTSEDGLDAMEGTI
ncbi:unnamed protein product [Closterium sp. Yama58-4]|nr:unnamed protein product [Closterium sp. Yama58-4]